jgi:hypothetical protein
MSSRTAEYTNVLIAPFLFALMGPPLGALIFQPGTLVPPWIFVALPFIYLIGFTPAIVAGVIFMVISAVLVRVLKIERLHFLAATLIGACSGLAVGSLIPELIGLSPFIITGVVGASAGCISAVLRPIGV